jgi:hypothetical protein
VPRSPGPSGHRYALSKRFPRLHRLIVPAALAAFLSVPSAIAKDGACTAEDGWSDCPAIAIKLEPSELRGEEVKANTPTALIYSAIEEGGTTQLIVADKDGDVIAYDTKTGAQRTLLSIPDISSINPERGLLGFALHPEFTTDAQKRRFYTYHTIPRSPEANANCKRLPPKPSPRSWLSCAESPRSTAAAARSWSRSGRSPT